MPGLYSSTIAMHFVESPTVIAFFLTWPRTVSFPAESRIFRRAGGLLPARYARPTRWLRWSPHASQLPARALSQVQVTYVPTICLINVCSTDSFSHLLNVSSIGETA